jgi:release factor glutamine methyltransferase
MPLDAVHEVEGELRAAGVPSPRVDAEILVADVLGTRARPSSIVLGPVTCSRRSSAAGARRAPRRARAARLHPRRVGLSTPRPEGRRPRADPADRRRRSSSSAASRSSTRLSSAARARRRASARERSRSRSQTSTGAPVLAVGQLERALSLARENKARVRRERPRTPRRRRSSPRVEGPFDLVVSNPPYVPPRSTRPCSPRSGSTSPIEAVVGSGDGPGSGRAGPGLLSPGGQLVLECGDGQAGGACRGTRGLGLRRTWWRRRTSRAADRGRRRDVAR